MNINYKRVSRYLLIISLFIFLVYFGANVASLSLIGKPVVKKIKLYSQYYNEKIYIKKKSWGITGSGQVIVISKSPDKDFQPDETQEYVFNGLQPFCYKFENDALFIFVRKKTTIPVKMSTKIEIKQIILDNTEMMTLFDDIREGKEKTIHNIDWE